jgi:hypothetical protein
VTFPRLPRFNRAAHVAPIQLTERDLEIVRLVGRYRFLRSTHIVPLADGSSQQILRRLQLLYHHEYLERPRAQLDYYYKTGSQPFAYALGPKGAEIAGRETDGPFHTHSWGKNNRASGRMFLDHALFVSDVMVAIELACRASGRVRLLSEDQLDQRHPFRWKVNIKHRGRLSTVPDYVFGLEFQNRDGQTSRAYFFLEADRGTMPVIRENLSQSSFYRKLLAYEATWSQRIHQTRFGFNRFRVITVTTSAERVKNLVSACSQLERGHGLFLFADNSILSNPASILDSVWQTAEPGITASVLD